MKKQHALALLCISLILATMIVNVVFAEEEQTERDEVEQWDERNLAVESEDFSVNVQSSFENGTMENQYDMQFSTTGGIQLKLGFSSEINSTEFELDVKVLFKSLVEYIDQNKDGVLSNGEAVQTIDLTTGQYATPTVTETTSADGKSGYRLESHILNENFTFQIIAVVFPTQAVVDGGAVKPSEAKVTIVVKDFPYQQNGSLALLIKAVSETEIEQEDHESEGEIEVNTQTAQGYFSWAKEAMVDGISSQVNSSVTATDEGKLITLNYANGKEIVHDPKLGFNLLAAVPNLPWLYVAAGAALVTVAVFVAIKVFRPKMHMPTFLGVQISR